MELGTSLRLVALLPITPCAVTSCYCSRLSQVSPHRTQSPRGLRTSKCGLSRTAADGRSRLWAGLSGSRRRLSGKDSLDFLFLLTQQRWAERPRPFFFRINLDTAGILAMIPPPHPLHRSPHRCCAGNLPARRPAVVQTRLGRRRTKPARSPSIEVPELLKVKASGCRCPGRRTAASKGSQSLFACRDFTVGRRRGLRQAARRRCSQGGGPSFSLGTHCRHWGNLRSSDGSFPAGDRSSLPDAEPRTSKLTTFWR
jgi:hypothetical protein